jgi:hypothetical protein
MISKDIKVPADSISSWSTSSRRTVYNCRANVEQRKVSEVPSRDTKANSFQNKRTEFRTNNNSNNNGNIWRRLLSTKQRRMKHVTSSLLAINIFLSTLSQMPNMKRSLFQWAVSRKVLLFMSIGRDYVSELRPLTGLLFILHRWYMGMESHGGMILTGENRRSLGEKTCPEPLCPFKNSYSCQEEMKSWASREVEQELTALNWNSEFRR